MNETPNYYTHTTLYTCPFINRSAQFGICLHSFRTVLSHRWGFSGALGISWSLPDDRTMSLAVSYETPGQLSTFLMQLFNNNTRLQDMKLR